MSYNFDAAVSPFIKALPPSGLAKFLDIMAANPNTVPLSVGEPDFDIPQAVKDAEINSICEGLDYWARILAPQAANTNPIPILIFPSNGEGAGALSVSTVDFDDLTFFASALTH